MLKILNKYQDMQYIYSVKVPQGKRCGVNVKLITKTL